MSSQTRKNRRQKEMIATARTAKSDVSRAEGVADKAKMDAGLKVAAANSRLDKNVTELESLREQKAAFEDAQKTLKQVEAGRDLLSEENEKLRAKLKLAVYGTEQSGERIKQLEGTVAKLEREDKDSAKLRRRLRESKEETAKANRELHKLYGAIRKAQDKVSQQEIIRQRAHVEVPAVEKAAADGG